MVALILIVDNVLVVLNENRMLSCPSVSYVDYHSNEG